MSHNTKDLLYACSFIRFHHSTDLLNKSFFLSCRIIKDLRTYQLNMMLFLPKQVEVIHQIQGTPRVTFELCKHVESSFTIQR